MASVDILPFELRYPHGAEPTLREQLIALDLAQSAGALLVHDSKHFDSPLERYQEIYDRLMIDCTLTDTVVARDPSGEIVGVAMYNLETPEPVDAELSIFAVSAEVRGRKIGSQLLRYVEHDVVKAGLDSVSLKSTSSARRIYAHKGYVPTNKFGRYYIGMTKNLVH